jgi:hypothetical protein
MRLKNTILVELLAQLFETTMARSRITIKQFDLILTMLMSNIIEELSGQFWEIGQG